MKLPEIDKIEASQIRKRLRKLFNEASPAEIQSGINWYAQAHKICADYSHEFGQSQAVVANILSALSPRNKWSRNIVDTYSVLHVVRAGISPDCVSVCTFNSNKFKAFEIAKNGLKISKTSPKTYAFVRNIADLDPNFVTIDVWHLRACFGQTIETGLTPFKYAQIQKITIDEAKKVGLKGYEYQAVIWEVIRNKS